MRPLRAGIVGTNFISDWFCESCLETKAILPCCVCSRDPERGRSFGGKYGITEIFDDYEKMLGSDIDLVYIANPNSLHIPYAEKALLRGKHVLCEKPAATDAASLTETVRKAKGSGLVFMEAMRTVHDPLAREIKGLICKFGPVRDAELIFRQYSSRYDSFKAGVVLNAFDPALGNAAVMDIGIYPVSLCTFLFGRPEKITSRSEILHNGFEGSGEAVFSYRDLDVRIAYSKTSAQSGPSRIVFDSAEVTIGKISTMDDVLISVKGSEPVPLMTERPSNNMIYEISDFAGAVRSGKTADEWNAYSMTAISCVDEIRKQNGIEFARKQGR